MKRKKGRGDACPRHGNFGSLWPGRKRYRTQEAGAGLFQGLRVRLTLWYCGVLSVALILFGVALYFGTQYFLLSPIASDAQMHAQGHINEWLQGQYYNACPYVPPGQSDQSGPFGPGSGPGQGFQMPEIAVCYTQNGTLPANENTTGLPSAFLNNDIVKSALQTGTSASDIVNGGSSGPIYRFAQVVPNGTGSGYNGVILIGESVKSQEAALALLLDLLLGLGGLALLGAGIGGLFLANRALSPARLAWSNQQRFIADAAHELRTPLTLLRADAEVLLRGRERLPEDDAMLLEDIVDEANHMGNLATNLLTLARLDSGTAHREHEVVNLKVLAQEMARRIQALATERGITVKVENNGDLYVIGDRLLLEQAVLGLLDNAIKYNHEGGQVIVHTESHDQHAVLEVRDTGVGIAAEHLPHLGERFYRVDKARSREAGGTGLGLSIARNIALIHGGTLRLASIPQQGTTVTLTLPQIHEHIPERNKDSLDGMASLPE
jgi:signal transduction histidine kinase